jgi:hypothetical protein
MMCMINFMMCMIHFMKCGTFYKRKTFVRLNLYDTCILYVYWLGRYNFYLTILMVRFVVYSSDCRKKGSLLMCDIIYDVYDSFYDMTFYDILYVYGHDIIIFYQAVNDSFVMYSKVCRKLLISPKNIFILRPFFCFLFPRL